MVLFYLCCVLRKKMENIELSPISAMACSLVGLTCSRFVQLTTKCILAMLFETQELAWTVGSWIFLPEMRIRQNLAKQKRNKNY